MPTNGQYTPWFAGLLKDAIDKIVVGEFGSPDFIASISQIARGINHAMANPGDIDPLLVDIGKNLYSVIYINLEKVNKVAPQSELTKQVNNKAASIMFSVDELKATLASRKKDKVQEKMRGSIDLLKNFDD